MVKGRAQGGGLPDVLAGKSSTTKKYGKRVVCDARETARQYERFQASLKPDIPVKKPHNPNRFDLVLFLQRCCSNEELPELPQTPAIRRGLRVLMLELDIPERDLRKMYKYFPSRSSAALCLARAGKYFGTERFADEIVVVEMSVPVVEDVSFGHPDGGHGTKTLVHDDKVSLVNGCFGGP